MRNVSRTTTPRVKNGKVQRKNRTQNTELAGLLDNSRFNVIRFKPDGPYFHPVRQPEVYRFVELIPDWTQISKGLSACVLNKDGDDVQQGASYERSYHAIWIDPFPKSLSTIWSHAFFTAHKTFVERLGARVEFAESSSNITIHWTESQARAWQLLHLFLYELKVHAEYITLAKNRRFEHSNSVAEAYAFQTAEIIWDPYESEFGSVFD